MMDFTFGIITGGGNDQIVEMVVNSILSQNIPNFEIIIIGDSNIKAKNTRVVSFDETQRNMWITRKKNIITEEAKYDNIVYLHDYVYLNRGWYKGFLEFGDDFNICMTKIINADGTRYRDWSLWAFDVEPLGVENKEFLLPYDFTEFSKWMYISGAYWVAKKNVMVEFPLDEGRLWGQSEDVIWSKQVREKYNFSMNTLSSTRLFKQKDRAFNEMSDETKKQIKTWI